MAGYTKTDMQAVFRRGYSYGKVNADVADDEVTTMMNCTLLDVQIEKESRPKRGENVVRKAWTEKGCPKEGVVLDGVRHVPLQFDK